MHHCPSHCLVHLYLSLCLFCYVFVLSLCHSSKPPSHVLSRWSPFLFFDQRFLPFLLLLCPSLPSHVPDPDRLNYAEFWINCYVWILLFNPLCQSVILWIFPERAFDVDNVTSQLGVTHSVFILLCLKMTCKMLLAKWQC